MGYSIEFHGDGTTNPKGHTSVVSAHGIRNIAGVDACLESPTMLALKWARAIVAWNGRILAVIARQPLNASREGWRYVVRLSEYNGQPLPFVTSPNATVVTAGWIEVASRYMAVEDWAGEQLSADGVGVAIITDNGRIQMAWEKVDGTVRRVVYRGGQ